ncbi:MAG: MlaD family protein [Gammaproteobacteria bacterium]|jgi:phospholipid/cholesterol/gamma-HCH transport system substrate-binding protein|nr:MlaD family protein [Gammaproteobacteria bacterium]
MRRDSINYLAVGTFVLVALAVLLVVLYKLTGQVGDSDPYYVHYANITGLADGSRVTYEGYQVGFVDGVEPVQDKDGTRYRVNLRIKRGWKIPEDSVARIYSAGLLAETVINIEEGGGRSYLAAGAEIPGAQGGDMFAALGSVADDIGSLTRDSLRPLLDNLNRLVADLGGELGGRVPKILGDVEAMVEKLDRGAGHLAGMLDARTRQGVRSIISDGEATARNFRELSAGLRATQVQLDALLGEAHGMVTDGGTDVRAAALALRQVLESVSGEVDGILFELEAASRNMNELSRELRGNPGLLLNGRPPVERGVNGD